ncbi:DUF3375 domain-containing protein [Collinsella tanakaei]|nr:DUF3375 domain-containing protein [Collinsella tanakaei]
MEVPVALIPQTLAYDELQRNATAWRLLRAQNAPVVIAILDEHLGGETSRRTVTELAELVATDLEALRERIPELDLRRSAREYCEQWRKDGYLVRRPAADARTETYELSSGALTAIGFAKALAKPHRTATKSRLSTIIDRVGALSLATNPDAARRRAALAAERERIDRQIERLDAGEVDIMDPEQALEQARDIIMLAQEIPRDFVNVSNDFEHISRSLYVRLINAEEGYRDTLEDIFAGVDQIAQSPSGKSFRGFYDLLRDAEASERFQDDVDAILANGFADGLDAEERKFLRRLLHLLIDQGMGVNETMTNLARGLRRFVQSQSFQQDRVLKRTIDRALANASTLAGTLRPTLSIDVELELTSTPIAPISRLKLKDPAESAAQPIERTEEATGAPHITLEDLRAAVRTVEIDFDELIGNVNSCLEQREDDTPISIGTVLARHPATQGVASVAGLISLAMDQGLIPEQHAVERATWVSAHGRPKQADIPLLLFDKEVR